MKTILKFDTGADGFKKMIYVLIVTALLLLGLGVYFLLHTFPSFFPSSAQAAPPSMIKHPINQDAGHRDV